jgi:hypothetical protein
MNIKMLCFGAMALSMASGAALAQSGSANSGALDDPAKMQPFYTDSNMTTIRTGDEFRTAFMAMSVEDQNMMRAACADELKNANPTNTHPEFCSNVKALGGEEGGGADTSTTGSTNGGGG